MKFVFVLFDVNGTIICLTEMVDLEALKSDAVIYRVERWAVNGNTSPEREWSKTVDWVEK